jgi:lipopolysaccharide export LptBFGC system permease protein LptF
VPIFITSLLLSGALFAFNHYLVPEADRRQNAIRAEIKGRPAQTFFNPGRTWFYGLEDRIFYYRYFDASANVMLAVNVFEIDGATFSLKRHIYAERARWEPSISAWVFQNGWSRDIQGNQFGRFDNFAGQARTFPELTETPDYFVKENIQAQQMNYLELRDYIADLRQSGFETAPLQVQYFKKFSEPLFTLILAMVSAPFAFQAGNRGAMAGVGISLAIFIGYWSVGQVFEQVGNLSQLPPAIAAWSPNAVFSLAGLYFLARVRT